ncbi:MAG: hypothetical protein GY710_12085 [Desulfobacteraceae bacterium]|nr:hypothetical protein [Desulfobacteraceae bacterium]
MFDISFEGIGLTGTVTFLKGIGVTVANENHVGKLSAAQTVDVCDAEDVFYGVIGKVEEENDILALERHGMNEVSFTGTITPGYKELVADGAGGVKEPASAGTGRMFHIVEVNDGDKLLMLDLG